MEAHASRRVEAPSSKASATPLHKQQPATSHLVSEVLERISHGLTYQEYQRTKIATRIRVYHQELTEGVVISNQNECSFDSSNTSTGATSNH